MRKLILALCMVVMVFALVGCGKKEPVAEKTDAEKFAEENSISVELAESIENSLSQTDVPSSLNKLNDWEQIEDYACLLYTSQGVQGRISRLHSDGQRLYVLHR